MTESSVQVFFRDKGSMMATALILLLLSFFIINWGLRDSALALWLGIILLAVGMILPSLSRFTTGERGDENGQGEDEEKKQEEPGGGAE